MRISVYKRCLNTMVKVFDMIEGWDYMIAVDVEGLSIVITREDVSNTFRFGTDCEVRFDRS